MSIDPLKFLALSPERRYPEAATGLSRQNGQSFEKLLKAAEAASLSAQELAREATEMMEMARLQMLQGLFDFDSETSAELPISQLQLPEAVSQKLDSFSRRVPDFQASLLSPAAGSRGEIDRMIERVAEHVSLAPELIRSVVSAESDFTPDAVSTAGAEGLMQLMPETARELGVKDSFDPLQNLLGGSRYLKQLLDKYDGDLDHALAAYNWGQGNVDRKGLEQMPQETVAYLAKVKGGLGLTRS